MIMPAMTMLRSVACLLLPCLLTACGSSGKNAFADWPAERLYAEAKGALQSGNYEQAKEMYTALESRSPFGAYGQQALLDLAYLYYKSEESDNAIDTCDRFIKRYPQHPHVDYAYYLRGLANFYRGGGLADRYLRLDASQRDPASKLQAFEYFAELRRKFPDSKYAPDAGQHMVYLRNILAKHEISVANYYLNRGAYLAAANRAQYVVQHYPRTPSTPMALAIMARAYKVLELEELSRDALRVLRLNYPQSKEIAEIERIRIK